MFVGGWILEAAEQICSSGEIETLEVLDLLSGLIDKSFVIGDTQSGHVRGGCFAGAGDHDPGAAALFQGNWVNGKLTR